MRLRQSAALRAVAALLPLGLLLGACSSSTGSGDSSSASTSNVANSSSLNGHGRQIVVFMPNDSLGPYITGDHDGIADTLEGLGYKVDVITNQFSQSQEDQQVQQYLGSGQKPAAFIWWPTDDASGINDTRLLSRVAPVIQFNQSVLPTAEPYVKLFVGDVDSVNGTALGKSLMAARAAQEKAGVKLHSSGGNLLVFDGPTGYQGSINRWAAFTTTTAAAPFKVVGTTYNTTAVDGYNNGLSIIPKEQGAGIDFVYAYDGDIATGAVKALLQDGYTPGKNVLVVDGNCTASLQPYLSGQIFATTLQSGVIEGIATAEETARYLATGKVLPGTANLPDTRELPTNFASTPSTINAIPVPVIVGAAQMKSAELWGYTPAELCANVYHN